MFPAGPNRRPLWPPPRVGRADGGDGRAGRTVAAAHQRPGGPQPLRSRVKERGGAAEVKTIARAALRGTARINCRLFVFYSKCKA